jgi:hypothetical protein
VQRLTRHRSLQMLQIYDDRRRQKADLQRFHRAFDIAATMALDGKRVLLVDLDW